MVDQVPGVVSELVASGAMDMIAHTIQVALTPVFLLSGIGTLLNTFNTRLARVSDHTEQIFAQMKDGASKSSVTDTAHFRRLQRRRAALDIAVMLGAIGCGATCGAALVLFFGGLRAGEIAAWLFLLFGLALVCTVGALAAFLVDTVLAWHGLHQEGPLPERAPVTVIIDHGQKTANNH